MSMVVDQLDHALINIAKQIRAITADTTPSAEEDMSYHNQARVNGESRVEVLSDVEEEDAPIAETVYTAYSDAIGGRGLRRRK